MVSQKITIKNPSGLHARPASIIVYGEKRIQVKSILNIMAAAIKCGTEVELQCTGETEEEDLKTLVTLIESGLGE